MSETLFYKRATFVAHLPVRHRYTASHTWLSEDPAAPGCWRVGLTRFALRMLGELVEVRYELSPGAPVALGEIVGNIEGFKALSDLYCVVDGTFEGPNPALGEGLEPITRDVHRTWLYQVRGSPDPKTLDVHAYAGVLSVTIDRILEKQAADPAPDTDVPSP
ncbi:MAG: glycine cleavage system protein H [Verrucomicrobiales bacterium]|nr:glycine cleavage system protein H [Verrucomicrobiales bacterium]